MDQDLTREEKDWLRRFLNSLDYRSRAMFWHLWQKGHAELEELRIAANLATDMEALMHVKDVLNPKACEFFGQPVLVFHRSKVNPQTGEKVLFNWWLELDPFSPGEQQAPIVDLFENGNTIMVVAEVPEIRIDSAELNYKNGILTVRLQLAELERPHEKRLDAGSVPGPGGKEKGPGTGCGAGQREDIPADIFDDGESLLVILDLPAVEESSIQVSLSGCGLRIVACSQGRDLEGQIHLPCPVIKIRQQTYRNGVLNIELEK
ncbi:hypothetical protein [Candidatus Formimonas warabiya]|uniref:Hsp20/alpha crystallin family protein n=1 Tax=Formimonas warabiya TaxID=1761012 RepID=A0A3G1KVF4_FORW1|nr:hypothetical protein [Candidatus Formimonas warabiya]ATW26434.1 hypothetical protein DCMF_18260 [Candidatus Formimonas warabiya]